MAVTLSPATSDGYLTLSAGNMTARSQMVGVGSEVWAWANAATPTGKVYFEVSVTEFPSGSIYAGIGPATSTQYGYGPAIACCRYALGGNSYYYDAAGLTSSWPNGGPSVPASSVLMVAYDTAANKIWFGANGTWFHGWNPAAGTGGVPFSFSGTQYAGIGLTVSGSDQRTGTVRFLASAFSYAVPTGFAAYEAAAGAPSVSPANATQAQTSTSPTISTANTVAPAAASQAHASTSPTITAKSAVAPADASQAHASTSPSIAAKSVVTPADAAQSHASTSPTIAAKSTVAPADASQTHAATSPTISAGGSVVVSGATHAHAATSPTTSAKSTVAPDSAVQAHVSTSPTLAAKSTVAPTAAAHGHTATSPTVVPSGSIAADSAAHAHSATVPTIAAKSTVAPASAAQSHTASSPSIGTAFTVTPASAAQAHASSSPTIAARNAVSPQDALHGHAATVPSLTFGAGIAVSSAAHAQTATQPFLQAHYFTQPANGMHWHTSTAPPLLIGGGSMIPRSTITIRPRLHSITVAARPHHIIMRNGKVIGKWTDKFPAGEFPNTIDWTGELDGAQITSCGAQVVRGDVLVDTPAVSSFSGAVQKVWVSGGTGGKPASVYCWVRTDDGRKLDTIARFNVLAAQ